MADAGNESLDSAAEAVERSALSEEGDWELASDSLRDFGIVKVRAAVVDEGMVNMGSSVQRG